MKKKPGKEAIAKAMKLPEGEKIRNKTADLSDWLIVISAAQMFQDIIDKN